MVEAWLAKADQALVDAAILYTRESLTGTMNRGYYAMFYAATALAIRDGFTFHIGRGKIASPAAVTDGANTARGTTFALGSDVEGAKSLDSLHSSHPTILAHGADANQRA